MTQWNRWNDKPAICDVQPCAVYTFGASEKPHSHHLEYTIDTSTTLFLSEQGLDQVRSNPDSINVTFADAIDIGNGKSPDELTDYHAVHAGDSATMYACDTIDMALWHSHSPAHALAHYVLGGYPAIGMVKGKESTEILIAPVTKDGAKNIADAIDIRSRRFNRHVLKHITAAMQPTHQQRI